MTAEIETPAIDPILQRTIEFLAGHYERGEYTANPGNVSNVVSVEITGDTALVTDCAQGLGALYSVEDELSPEHTSHTGDRRLRSTIRWQVSYTCSQYCGTGQLNDYVIINTGPIITHEILVIET